MRMSVSVPRHRSAEQFRLYYIWPVKTARPNHQHREARKALKRLMLVKSRRETFTLQPPNWLVVWQGQLGQ